MCSVLVVAGLSACGDGEATTQGPTGNAKGLGAELRSCGYAAAYRVTDAPADACGDYPRDGEEARFVTAADGSATLVLGALELPLAKGAAACTFVAAGCQDRAADDHQSARYLSPTIAVSLVSGKLQLAAEAVDVLSGQVGPCKEGAFVADAVPACDPIGRWAAASDAAVTSGSCEYAWPAGDVVISADANGSYTIDWGGNYVSGATLDAASCTLTVDKGIAPNIWISNGTMRHLQLALTFAGASLSGTAQDAADSPDMSGKTCAGGTFALAATRATQRAATALAATCASPAPSACGDGVCSADESCQCESDCACAAGTECLGDGACRAPCALESETTDCGAGEKCVPFGGGSLGPARNIFPNDHLYCAIAGTGAAHDVCDSTAACQAGLVCHTAMRGQVWTCAAPCGEGFAACGEGESCGVAGDGSGTGSYPDAVKACEHPAGLGESCASDPCSPELGCLTWGSGAEAQRFCSKSCTYDSDCPSSLGECHPIAKYCVPN